MPSTADPVDHSGSDSATHPNAPLAPMAPLALLKPLLRGWSHVVSFCIVAVLGTTMIVTADASPVQRLWLVVYLAGTLSMLGVSALYHRLNWTDTARARMRRLDHSTIFLAITGAYMPVVTTVVTGWQRPTILIVAWVGSIIGIALQWLPVHVPRAAFTSVYVLVGWCSSLAFSQLIDGLGPGGFALLLSGGIAYTIGAVVYAAKWPDPWPQVFGYHEVFHALTVIGAGCHLAMIAFAVIPKF